MLYPLQTAIVLLIRFYYGIKMYFILVFNQSKSNRGARGTASGIWSYGLLGRRDC